MKKCRPPLLLAVVLLTAFFACNSPTESSPPDAEMAPSPPPEAEAYVPGFVHTVYFWLKDDVDAERRAAFFADMKNLAAIESVRGLYAGPPAQTPREVVDNSYDFGLTVFFDDRSGHDFYQQDSIHLALIQTHQNLWQRVQVYDHLVE